MIARGFMQYQKGKRYHLDIGLIASITGEDLERNLLFGFIENIQASTTWDLEGHCAMDSDFDLVDEIKHKCKVENCQHSEHK
jgi:hypothetical protein